jgi:hypothetical protein
LEAGFRFEEFPKASAHMDVIRSRSAWQKTPKLMGLRRDFEDQRGLVVDFGLSASTI